MALKARVHYPGPERCRSAEPGTGRGNAPRLDWRWGDVRWSVPDGDLGQPPRLRMLTLDRQDRSGSRYLLSSDQVIE